MQKPKYPEVYNKIIEILESNGFVNNGETIDRKESGCQFGFSCLNKYETVVDFQLEWSYAMNDSKIKHLNHLTTMIKVDFGGESEVFTIRELPTKFQNGNFILTADETGAVRVHHVNGILIYQLTINLI